MKHRASQELYAYWNKQRGSRLAPSRSEIDPAAIRGVLGDCFMLTRDPNLEPTFRLAGTHICDMFGRELKGVSFPSLWDAQSCEELDVLLNQIVQGSIGFVAGVTGKADDNMPVAFELLLLPLFGAGTAEARSIGTLAPMTATGRLQLQSASTLTLAGWRHVGPQIESSMLPRFADVPSVAPTHPAMTVHSGGRS
jgi:hypothetical protein